mmetsp:Transcript_69923/g.186275  ORF Transcript_69923/g.186275 Transcript_69923/m.186275 type:complete len:331 (-) Transcript_69923:1486-2478(-)
MPPIPRPDPLELLGTIRGPLGLPGVVNRRAQGLVPYTVDGVELLVGGGDHTQEGVVRGVHGDQMVKVPRKRRGVNADAPQQRYRQADDSPEQQEQHRQGKVHKHEGQHQERKQPRPLQAPAGGQQELPEDNPVDHWLLDDPHQGGGGGQSGDLGPGQVGPHPLKIEHRQERPGEQRERDRHQHVVPQAAAAEQHPREQSAGVGVPHHLPLHRGQPPPSHPHERPLVSRVCPVQQQHHVHRADRHRGPVAVPDGPDRLLHLLLREGPRLIRHLHIHHHTRILKPHHRPILIHPDCRVHPPPQVPVHHLREHPLVQRHDGHGPLQVLHRAVG